VFQAEGTDNYHFAISASDVENVSDRDRWVNSTVCLLCLFERSNQNLVPWAG
jgi:hypothetical protein